MKNIQIIALSSTFLLVILVVGLGLWSLSVRSPVVPIVGQVDNESPGIPNRPYVEPIMERGGLLEKRADGSLAVVGVGRARWV